VALKEGILADAKNGKADFVETEINELQIGLYEKMGSIYRIYNENLPLKGSKDYDLYLFIDINSSNKSMGNKFKAGVSVKAYDKLFETLSEHIISQYTGVQGENNLFYHGENFIEGALDDSYRFGGRIDKVNNNYICFGSDIEHCSSDNLYRIIGVFGSNNHGISYNLVKLIKYDYASKNLLGSDGNYYGSTTPPKSLYKGALSSVDTYTWKNNANAWSWSSLNKTNLNTNFLSNIGTTWADKIISVNWVTGGNTSAKVINTTAKNAYANEITSPASTLTTANKIGMMYVSDYGFAAGPSAWSYNMNVYSSRIISSVNWMRSRIGEWSITRYSDAKGYACILQSNGSVWIQVVNNGYEMSSGYGIRPVFFLNPSVTYAGGTGTSNDPIILS